MDDHNADAAILAAQQANLAVAEKAAIVNSDLQNINAKQLLYNQCMMQQGPPGPNPASPIEVSQQQVQWMEKKASAFVGYLTTARHDADAIRRIEWKRPGKKDHD